MRRPVPVIQVSGDVGADRHQVKTEADQHDTLVRKEGMWEGRKVGGTECGREGRWEGRQISGGKLFTADSGAFSCF